MHTLEAKSLSKTIKKTKIVHDISIDVKNGEVVGLLGPNGAGKTTLVNMITGVYKVDDGTIFLDGADITNISTNKLVYRGICRTFQNLEICKNMTVLENILLGFDKYMDKGILKSCFRAKSILDDEQRYKERALHLLDLIGLKEYANIKANNLSYGILKKLEIIRALATSPELILLDEPVAGLNPKETQEVANLIKTVVQDEVTVILVEHDMKMVMDISDYITVINFGKFLAKGKPLQIQNHPEVIKAYLGNQS